MAQFRELQAFAQMGSELDKISQAQLDRGYRLTELLKQPLNSPMPVEEQVVVFIAGTRGYLDPIPVEDVKRFETELLQHFRTRHANVLDGIRTSGAIADEAALENAVKEFAELFAPSVKAGDAPGGLSDPGTSSMATAPTHLPEEEVTRPEEDSH
jgi:F-type H+-transporting ATPase subunit alpha